VSVVMVLMLVLYSSLYLFFIISLEVCWLFKTFQKASFWALLILSSICSVYISLLFALCLWPYHPECAWSLPSVLYYFLYSLSLGLFCCSSSNFLTWMPNLLLYTLYFFLIYVLKALNQITKFKMQFNQNLLDVTKAVHRTNFRAGLGKT